MFTTRRFSVGFSTIVQSSRSAADCTCSRPMTQARLESPQQKKLGYIPQTHVVPESAQQHLKHDVCGHWQKVKWCPSSFIELPLTLLTPKHLIPQFSFSLQLGSLARVAVRTVHQLQSVLLKRHLSHSTRTGVLLPCCVLSSDTFFTIPYEARVTALLSADSPFWVIAHRSAKSLKISSISAGSADSISARRVVLSFTPSSSDKYHSLAS